MMRLTGKHALVTGAAHGIGRAVALRFAAEGAKVTGIDLALPDSAANDATLAPILYVQADVTDRAALDAALAMADDVSILVNVAGVVAHGSVLDCTQEDWRRTFSVNVDAVFHLCQLVIPRMQALGGGSIVNVSSMVSSLAGVPNRFAYGASKAAVIGITKSIAADFIRAGIRCNAVCPGTIDSPSLADRVREQSARQSLPEESIRRAFEERQPMGRLGTADEVASLITYLASDEAGFTTGEAYAMAGGWTG